MDVPKNGYEQAAISLAPIKTDMTLDEFCQSDLEGSVSCCRKGVCLSQRWHTTRLDY